MPSPPGDSGNSVGVNRSSENEARPSSIQACRRSSLPTTMGHHMCASSWEITPYSERGERPPPTMVIMGYSMPPPMMPSFTVIWGYG